jgi:hypothetical protein
MFNVFLGWLRSSVKSAVLAGVNDAVGELTTDAGGNPEADHLAAQLRQRLATLPGPAADLATDGNGHGQVEPAAKGRRRKDGE